MTAADARPRSRSRSQQAVRDEGGGSGALRVPRLRALGVAGVQGIGSHVGKQAMLARGLPRVVRLAWPQGPSIRGCSQSTHYCVVICDGLMPGRHLLTRVRVVVHAPTSGFQWWTRF